MGAETGPWSASAKTVPHTTGSVTLQKGQRIASELGEQACMILKQQNWDHKKKRNGRTIGSFTLRVSAASVP